LPSGIEDSSEEYPACHVIRLDSASQRISAGRVHAERLFKQEMTSGSRDSHSQFRLRERWYGEVDDIDALDKFVKLRKGPNAKVRCERASLL
jgi:hypothetical protein